MEIAENLPSGMSPEEARRQALIRFGGVEPVKKSMRDRVSLGWVDEALRDIRYALRGLRRSPGFAVVTLLSLTLGLGASLAIFTIADNLLVRPLPYRDVSGLLMAWEADRARCGRPRGVARTGARNLTQQATIPQIEADLCARHK